jgi:hypothetical protein
MRNWTFLAICAATAVYVLIAGSMWGSPSFIDLPFEAIKILYVPSAVTAGVCGCIALFQLIFGRKRAFYAVCLGLCLPMLAYFSYRPRYFYMKGYQGDQTMQWEFVNDSRGSVLRYALNYYELHPDRFHRTGVADEVRIEGFADYIRSLSPTLTWKNLPPRQWNDSSDPVRVDGTEILAPWGSPIVFLLDTSGSGYITTLDGGKRSVNEYQDPKQKPHFSYHVAVGMTTRDKRHFLSGAYGFDDAAPVAVLNDDDYHNKTMTLPDWRETKGR